MKFEFPVILDGAMGTELMKRGYQGGSSEYWALMKPAAVLEIQSGYVDAASDVIYIPTDNTAAASTETIRNILVSAKIPAIVGEEGICKGCGVATLSISYYDLGYKTGEMAAKILKGESKIAEMPIEYAPAVKKYNAELAAEYGLTIPEGFEAIE